MTPALQLLLKHGFSVFPIVPNGKIPFPGTKGFKDASKDPDTITRMFSQRPGANVAIATGDVSGVFILDIDNHVGGGDGRGSLQELEKLHGELPETVEVLTPSGGRHLYFKQVPGLRSVVNIRPGVDTRANGSYVVCPPSVFEGNAYVWEAAHHTDDCLIANAPDWLIELVTPKPAEAPTNTPLAPGSTKSAADGKVPGPDKFIAGNRNSKLMLKGVALRKQGLSQEAILFALNDLNISRCHPPLLGKEVAIIAGSVAKYEPEAKKPVNFTKEPLTDVWNAAMFHADYGDSIRFCNALGGWHVWDGTRWVKDEFKILTFAKATVKRMFKQAQETEQKDLYRHAERTESEGRLRSMINLVRDHDGINLTSDDFDCNQVYATFDNGTLDLPTGTLLPHTKSHHITKKIHMNYVPDAVCPTWERFIVDIFMDNPETIHFVQKAVGYSLCGLITEQCLFILYGVGSNGKSTFLETISKVFGDYSTTTLASTIMEKQNGGIPNDVARLKGARFVNALETDENKRIAEAVIKTLTGGDKIVARFLNKEFFEFHATFKLFLATNHKPRISGTDNGIWRRIRFIPFKNIITPEKRDQKLQEKLLAEHEGIMAWAVRGFQMWQAEGLGTCPDIEDATKNYREESDIIADYISDRYDVGGEYAVQSSALLKDLAEWCKEMGFYKISRGKLFEYLESKNITKKMATAGEFKGCNFWHGIGLKTSRGSSDSKPLLGDFDENGRPF